MDPAARRFDGRLWTALLALVLAFGFLGSRPVWDPDEGRYSNVALNMLESGDWLHPMRSHEAGHWTKPPLTYWSVASSVAVFGYTPFAVRLPVALAYLACVFMVWRMARRLVPQRAGLAPVVFATMALPASAAQLLTTDFILTACVTAAMWAYVELRFGDGRHHRGWSLLLWAGFGLGFLTKGPPALLPLLAVVALQWGTPADRRPALGLALGLPLFAVLGLGWFAVVVAGHPDLLRYFIGEEVVERVAGHGFDRNAGPFGWLLVYGPTLLLGSLPWTRTWLRWLRAAPRRLRGWRDGDAAQAMDRVLLAWIALPLLVLCLASSRLPLYVLPLCVPIALAIARQGAQDGLRLRPLWLALWVLLLLGLRVLVAHHDTHKDAGAWAEAIRSRVAGPVAEVVFIDDMARYGLHLHLGAGIEKVTIEDGHALRQADGFDHDLGHELDEHEARVVYVTKREQWPRVLPVLQAHGVAPQTLGPDLYGRVLFTVRPLADGAPGHPAVP